MKDRWAASMQKSAVTVGVTAVAMAAAMCLQALGDAGGQGARAVRLSSVEGGVQVSQGGQMLADPALPNTPLFEGSQVATAEGGQAEIQFEDGSIVRLTPNSSVELRVLRGLNNSAESEFAVSSGLVYFEIQSQSGPAHWRVRVADALVNSTGFTVLRVNMDNPPGDVAVFSGNAHLQRDGVASLDLHGGQDAVLNAGAPGQFKISDSIQTDSWDAWNADRDQALQNEYSKQTGTEQNQADGNNPAWADLDANGNWYNVPGEGYVWSPTEAANPAWDPYGNGNWMWTPGYGYIWISGSPWGYMPYQCGAWNFYNSFGWGWSPGMGCQPWWIGGGWGFRLGSGPGRYRPPVRPVPGNGPIRVGGGHGPIHPGIPVVRQLSGLSALPPRNAITPVQIAGYRVTALSPVSAVRPSPAGQPKVFANRGLAAAPSMQGRTVTPAYSQRPAMPGTPRPAAQGFASPSGHPSPNGGSRTASASHGGGSSAGSHGGAPSGGGGGHVGGGGGAPSGGGGGGGHPSGGGSHR